jgi:hypothetical protein
MVSQKQQSAYPIVKVHPEGLLFFVDDSGHEEFADPKYPVYALGGCAVLAAEVNSTLREPWRRLKARHFGGAQVPLHASELRNPTTEQMEALNAFFRAQAFGRFAVAMTNLTGLPVDTKPIELMPEILRRRYEDVGAKLAPRPKEVAFIHEASERGNPLLQRYFGTTDVTVDGNPIPVHHLLMHKGDEALEIADFVVHTAGRQARLGMRSGKPLRKDFVAIFHAQPTLTSVMFVDTAEKLARPPAASR